MKKLCLFYTNCQGDGILHFLRQCDLADEYEFKIYHNWQIILGEQNADDLTRDAYKADVFIYQPHKAQHGALSTDDYVYRRVPERCKTISFAYAYNHGFFPIVKHPGGWHTGREVMDRALRGNLRFTSYSAGVVNFDCVGRFAECLAEQARREEQVNLKFVPFILAAYRHVRLFLTENHPTSTFFEHMAHEVYKRMRPGSTTLPNWGHKTDNDAGLPCRLAHHPIVTAELGLEFTRDPNDTLTQYDDWMKELIAKKGGV